MWDRLEEKYEELKKPYEEYIEYFEQSLRIKAWSTVAWNTCSYCIVFGDCTECPLFIVDACFGHVANDDERTVTSRMFKAWLDNDRHEFEKERRKLRKALRDTKEEFMNEALCVVGEGGG